MWSVVPLFLNKRRCDDKYRRVISAVYAIGRSGAYYSKGLTPVEFNTSDDIHGRLNFFLSA